MTGLGWVETFRVKPTVSGSVGAGAGRRYWLARLARYWVVPGAMAAARAASQAWGVMVISALPAETAL